MRYDTEFLTLTASYEFAVCLLICQVTSAEDSKVTFYGLRVELCHLSLAKPLKDRGIRVCAFLKRTTSELNRLLSSHGITTLLFSCCTPSRKLLHI